MRGVRNAGRPCPGPLSRRRIGVSFWCILLSVAVSGFGSPLMRIAGRRHYSATLTDELEIFGPHSKDLSRQSPVGGCLKISLGSRQALMQSGVFSETWYSIGRRAFNEMMWCLKSYRKVDAVPKWFRDDYGVRAITLKGPIVRFLHNHKSRFFFTYHVKKKLTGGMYGDRL